MKSGTVQLDLNSFKYDILPNGARYTLQDDFNAVSPDQGLGMSGNTGHLLVATAGKRSKIRSGDADRNVHLSKTVKSPNGNRTSEVSGSHADLSVSGDEDTVKMKGPVKIVDTDAAKHEVLVATGDSGTVWLTDQTEAKGSGLKEGALIGNVTVHVKQVADKAGGQPGTLDATGARMDYNNRQKPPTLRLQGNVRLSGLSSGMTWNSSLGYAVLTLNDSGEVTNVSGGKS